MKQTNIFFDSKNHSRKIHIWQFAIANHKFNPPLLSKELVKYWKFIRPDFGLYERIIRIMLSSPVTKLSLKNHFWDVASNLQNPSEQHEINVSNLK
jgi:hypothetical protein